MFGGGVKLGGGVRASRASLTGASYMMNPTRVSESHEVWSQSKRRVELLRRILVTDSCWGKPCVRFTLLASTAVSLSEILKVFLLLEEKCHSCRMKDEEKLPVVLSEPEESGINAKQAARALATCSLRK